MQGECGTNPDLNNGFIVGGEDTLPGEFPSAALLGYAQRKREWNDEKGR